MIGVSDEIIANLKKHSPILFEKMYGLYGLYQASDIATIMFHTRTNEILTPAN